MRSNLAEILAEIKLNYASVEQFLAIAQGLADDNPAIRAGVYEAAEEVRSAAILVDHLRSLFSHQQAIEHQNQFGGQYVPASGRQNFEASELRDDGSGAEHLATQNQRRPAFDSENVHQRNLQIFTYSNQTTLIKAAKCLIANVAKILYLTESIVSGQQDTTLFDQQQQQQEANKENRQETFQHQQQPQHQNEQQIRYGQRPLGALLPSRQLNDNNNANKPPGHGRLPAPNYEPTEKAAAPACSLARGLGVSDRLDNVANYSQLLRSFSELSAQLVDLGQCLMLTRSLKKLSSRGHQKSSERGCYTSTACGQVLHQQQQMARSRSFAWPDRQLELQLSNVQQATTTTTLDGLELHSDSQLGGCLEQQQLANSRLARPSSSSCCPMQNATTPLQLATMMPTMFEIENNLERQYAANDTGALYDRRDSCTISVEIKKPTATTTQPSSSQFGDILAQINDMQTLFQVNRLIMDRSILLLLSASKCCLRQNGDGQYLHGLEARRSVAAQIRVSMSIIMAIVKCSVFGQVELDDSAGSAATAADCSSLAAAEAAAHQRLDKQQHYAPATLISRLHANTQQHQQQSTGGGPKATRKHEEHLAGLFLLDQSAASATGSAAGGGGCANSTVGRPNEIIKYFLQSFNGVSSAHDSIVRLQNELCLELDEALYRNRTRGTSCTNNGAQHELLMETNHHQLEHNQQQDDDEMRNDNNSKENNCRNQASQRSHLIYNHHHQTTSSTTIFDEMPPVLLMDKRQLVRALNLVFLGDSRAQLIERLHEFTDCAYTRHEQRESIVLLLACIKLQLNKFVRLIYRLRRRTASPSESDQFNQLRQLACHLVDTCAELNYELQTVVIEQSDELDRCNNQLDLIKQLKHHCSVGDIPKTQLCSGQFHEQSEQLIEVCRMLNQVASTNKLKIMTKTLAIWFELNLNQLLSAAQCLSESSHRSRVTKDFVWGFIQVWCSFYDDFCQLARQVAYLAHSQFDSLRSARVASIKEQVLARQLHHRQPQSNGDLSAADAATDQFLMRSHLLGCNMFSTLNDSNNSSSSTSSLFMATPTHGAQQQQAAPPLETATHPANGNHEQQQQQLANAANIANSDGRQLQHCDGLRSIGSVQSLDNLIANGCASAPAQQLQLQQQGTNFSGAGEPLTDSPRSLDHYYGFGANYRRSQRCFQDQQQQQDIDDELLQFGRQRQIEQVVDETATLIDHFEADCQRQRRYRGAANQVFANTWPETPPLTSLAGPVAPPHSLAFNEQRQQQSFMSINGDSGHFRPVSQLSQHHQLTTIESSVDDFIHPPAVPMRSTACAVTASDQQLQHQQQHQPAAVGKPPMSAAERQAAISQHRSSRVTMTTTSRQQQLIEASEDSELATTTTTPTTAAAATIAPDQQSVASTSEGPDKWSDSEADAIVRGARETAQMAMSMYQFTRGEGELNTTQDLFTQAELFAEEANELYKEVRCFSYKVPAGDLKKQLLNQLSTIPALVQQLQFIVKNPTVGKAATFAKVDSVIRETRNLMEAVNRVVDATLSCRQHYNMAIASMRKRTRTLSPSYRGDKGFEFDSSNGSSLAGGGSGRHQSAFGSRAGGGGPGGSMGSEPDI